MAELDVVHRVRDPERCPIRSIGCRWIGPLE